MQCCFNVATRTNQMDRRCLLTSGFIRVQCTGTNCSSLTTPINISMFSGLWKWEKICTGFICFSNFSIIATRLSKLFPLQNLLYSPTQGKRKVKNKRFSVRLKKIIKNPWSINLHNQHLSSCALHTSDLCGKEQHPGSSDNHFCALPVGLTHCCEAYSWPGGAKQICFPGAAFPDSCKPQWIGHIQGKEAGTDVTSHLPESLCYLIMDRFVCNFWVWSKRYYCLAQRNALQFQI